LFGFLFLAWLIVLFVGALGRSSYRRQGAGQKR